MPGHQGQKWHYDIDLLSLLGFVNLTLASIICEEETSTEELSPSDWPVGKSQEHFLD